MKIRFIDCITHALTGSAILRACGIRQDGTVEYADSLGYPLPVCLVVRHGAAKKKLNTIRTTLSNWARIGMHDRFFSIEASEPLGTHIKIGDDFVPVQYIILRFTSGGRKMQMAAVVRRLIARGNHVK